MEYIKFSIDESTANVRFLLTHQGQLFLDGESIVRRASHIEPSNMLLRVLFIALRGIVDDSSRIAEWTRTWNCAWRVNLIPVNGPVIDHQWLNRADAIQFEIEWLNVNFI